MLFDENCGRREQSDLLPLEHRLERGADRDLGFPVTDVAAQQPVHRSLGLHVALDVLNRTFLIRREVELEGILELPLPRRVGREGETPRRVTNRRETQELGRHFAHRFLDARLAPSPGTSTQAIEPGTDIGITAGIFLDQIRPLDRHQQRVAALVGEGQHFELSALYRHPSEACETPDAVVHVHDQVSRTEIAQIRREDPPSGAPPPRRRGGSEIAAPVHREPAVPEKTQLRPTFDDRHPTDRRRRSDRLDPPLAQQMGEAPTLSRGGRHQDLRHILSTSRTKRRHEIREAADEALRGVGGKAPPGRRAVHQLEAFQTQRGAFDQGAELLRRV